MRPIQDYDEVDGRRRRGGDGQPLLGAEQEPNVDGGLDGIPDGTVVHDKDGNPLGTVETGRVSFFDAVGTARPTPDGLAPPQGPQYVEGRLQLYDVHGNLLAVLQEGDSPHVAEEPQGRLRRSPSPGTPASPGVLSRLWGMVRSLFAAITQVEETPSSEPPTSEGPTPAGERIPLFNESRYLTGILDPATGTVEYFDVPPPEDRTTGPIFQTPPHLRGRTLFFDATGRPIAFVDPSSGAVRRFDEPPPQRQSSSSAGHPGTPEGSADDSGR